jgi:hypothetical protein
MQDRPVVLSGAAAAQAAEAAGVLIASVLSAMDTAAGKSYQLSSGIALTAIGFATAGFLAVVAAGLVRVRPWSRTPALLSQLFTLIVGIIMLQGHRVEWGAPAVLLAVAAAAALLLPASLRALAREPRSEPAAAARNRPVPPAARNRPVPPAARKPRTPPASRR